MNQAKSKSKALVGVSRRAKESISSTGLTLDTISASEPSESNTAERIFGFQPAKAIVTVSQTSTTTETSKITGRPYKKRSSDSYTFPFGRDSATDTYARAKQEILSKVSAGDNNRGVSFDAEIYR